MRMAEKLFASRLGRRSFLAGLGAAGALPILAACAPQVIEVERVQIVEKENRSILRPILEEWYERTGCPMLLNTSLNIKGQPMVNNWNDAKNFMEKYDVAVY